MTTRTCFVSSKNDENYFTEITDVTSGSSNDWAVDLIDHRIEKEAILKFNGICDTNPIVLSEILRNWLKENNMTYTVGLNCKCSYDDEEECNGVDWYIDIPDNDEAMLFKLTWG